jgi:hypothetical protein
LELRWDSARIFPARLMATLSGNATFDCDQASGAAGSKSAAPD